MAVVSTEQIVRNIYNIAPHNQSVYQLVRSSNKDFEPNTSTLVSTATGQSYTRQEFWSQVDNVSQQLLRHGFQEGQVMAIFSPNCPEYLITLFGVWKAGGTVACVSPLWKSGEVSRFFRLVMPKWVLTTPDLASMILTMNRDFQVQIILTSGTLPGCTSWGHMTQKGSDHVMCRSNWTMTGGVDWHKRSALILSSSGTTGLPKAVDLSHGAIGTSLISGNHPSLRPPSSARVVFQPLSHVLGMTLALLSLLDCSTLLLMARFNLKQYLEIVCKHKVRCLNLVPAVLVQLRSSPLALNYDLSHVEDVIFGSSTIGSAVVETVMNRFGKSTRRRQGYAMTESAGGGTIASGEKAAVSIGIPMPCLEMKVIDLKSGQTLGPNQKGEICIRSPTLMTGYVGNPRATKEAIDSDHWLHTGDIGYFDNDGYFYFVERLKEIIKYSSFQVAPAELEALLLTHHAIADAAVFGTPDPVKGELPTAWVVLKEPYVGVQTQKEIVDFVAEQVAHYKKLRGGVRFVSNIPRSDSGKIQRWKMRDLANSKL